MEIDITTDDSVEIAIQFATTLSSVPTGLTATPVAGGGTFAAGTYYWEVTATTGFGETTVSNEASTAVALNGSANLSWTAPPNKVTGYKVYRGTASGVENTLVATLAGSGTTYTDTGGGGAGAPPGGNTAVLSDLVLLTGAGRYLGYTVAETTATGPAYIELQDTTGNLAECRLAQGTSDSHRVAGRGIDLNGSITLHTNAGYVRGAVYVAIPRVNC